MKPTEREAKLLKEMRYIAGISNGQVKRVADAALASMVEPTPSDRTDELALDAAGKIMHIISSKGETQYGYMNEVQIKARIQCIVKHSIELGIGESEVLSVDRINELWTDALRRADPAAGNAHIKFARAIEAEINGVKS